MLAGYHGKLFSGNINAQPHTPGARRGSPSTQCRSFLNGLTKMLGRDQGKRDTGGEQPSILGNTPDRPVFPPYTIISKARDYSIRLYNVFPVVEMEYERREEGYASLGSYIDGRNSQGVCFAYSQPVVMCYYPDGRKIMQMYVGPQRAGSSTKESAAEAASSLPSPLDPGVRINVAGGELVAVLQFEGFITPASVDVARRRLRDCLEKDGIRLSEADAAGLFRCAQYGAVYQLGGRLNELMQKIDT